MYYTLSPSQDPNVLVYSGGGSCLSSIICRISSRKTSISACIPSTSDLGSSTISPDARVVIPVRGELAAGESRSVPGDVALPGDCPDPEAVLPVPLVTRERLSVMGESTMTDGS